ncbi:BolA family protein [Candidatus Rariloculus sp.]|uniref:BolA family protein n=1 Tax=Candidatus Rariloculus sp. TaxID=3101265 RepID=UPI003D096A67
MTRKRIASIRALLDAALAPTELEIIDESDKHAGHAGARDGKSHFRVRIVSARFQGAKPLERHRLVFDALGDMLETDIHALSVVAQAPAEARNSE